jgi:hypothetical protein
MNIGPWASRGLAAAVIVPTAALSLPIAATFLDHPPGRENFIFPAQLVAMGGIGAAVGAALPHMVSGSAGHGKGAAVGAAVGIGAAVLADVGLFALIAG